MEVNSLRRAAPNARQAVADNHDGQQELDKYATLIARLEMELEMVCSGLGLPCW